MLTDRTCPFPKQSLNIIVNKIEFSMHIFLELAEIFLIDISWEAME